MEDALHAPIDCTALTEDIRSWAHELGFDAVGISGVDLTEDEGHLMRWLDEGMYGQMHYMTRHGTRRSRPRALVPGTVRVISVRMDHLPPGLAEGWSLLDAPERGYVARYALGRDYHKLMRKRLQTLADRIRERIGDFGYRAFVDSAPVLEKALARNAGLGWIGKHTLLLSRKAGSWFMLGELFTDLPLPVDAPATAHCGSCRRCIDVCPTGAIVAPYKLDARRCISYLTIELKGSIPKELRAPMGNRIFGCDDCQLVCPWNKFAQHTDEPDFAPRHGLDGARLVDLFAWDEATFMHNTEGMAIRRAGYQGWLRNIAVALGNAPSSPAVIDALKARAGHASPIVREHVAWALERHEASTVSAGRR